MRDAFGRLLVDPESLDLAERVDCMRRAAGALAASDTAEGQWLGRVLLRWLRDGGDLLDALRMRPARGSTLTPQAMVAQDARDRALLRLSSAVGGDARALAVLQGAAPCPAHCVDLLEQAGALRIPASRHAFSRARRRVARHQP